LGNSSSGGKVICNTAIPEGGEWHIIIRKFDIFCNTKTPIKVDMEFFLRCADSTMLMSGYQVSIAVINFRLLYILISKFTFLGPK